MAFDASLLPTEFFARTLMEYVVPFVSPEIEIGDVVTAGSGVTQLDPPSNEYS